MPRASDRYPADHNFTNRRMQVRSTTLPACV